MTTSVEKGRLRVMEEVGEKVKDKLCESMMRTPGISNNTWGMNYEEDEKVGVSVQEGTCVLTVF